MKNPFAMKTSVAMPRVLRLSPQTPLRVYRGLKEREVYSVKSLYFVTELFAFKNLNSMIYHQVCQFKDQEIFFHQHLCLISSWGQYWVWQVYTSLTINPETFSMGLRFGDNVIHLIAKKCSCNSCAHQDWSTFVQITFCGWGCSLRTTSDNWFP